MTVSTTTNRITIYSFSPPLPVFPCYTMHMQKLHHEQIQYIEFLSQDLTRIKTFYTNSFNRSFTDYGSDYTAFEGTYVDGGFTLGNPKKGSVLVILFSETLEATKEKVLNAGGATTKDIFSFPGGRRFQFNDPDGNELAVWSNT